MKNTVIIFSMLFAIAGCKAQVLPPPLPANVVPLEDYHSFINTHDKIPDGTYFKDVNDVLDKYVGTWVGTYNGNNYVLYITKRIGVIVSSSKKSLKFDELGIRYKISTGTGITIVNTLNLPEDSVYVMFGLTFSGANAQIYTASYVGENTKCGNSGTLYIEITNASQTQMSLYIDPDEVLYGSDDCPNGYLKPPFPFKSEPPMVLTKQ